MRFMYYNKDTTSSEKAIHFVALERVDCFSFVEKGEITEMYANIGDDVHVLNSTKKILNPQRLIGKLLELSDRVYVSIDTVIDDCNSIEKTKLKSKR